ncbi:hypothetical protein BTO00_23655 [Vibrio campbellii]|uniref:DUF262 domain-containing protein n=1 Tax=Vibrio campbellii TaxID=680 RepID=UPI000D4A9FA3|nr:DUF262 domain-containing protein [Vibrio campbellii]PQJ37281.1 hypothetical protein BTO00_23655 [Vibrio campbellii]
MKPSDFLDFEKKSPKFFADGFKKGTLIIDNSFQRRGVWVEKDKISLIESILLGYPIPELYLWETGISDDPDNVGELTYSIVDGQQRITAIWDFINDKFALKPNCLEFSDAAYAGKKFSELLRLEEHDFKSDFWLYKFHVRTIAQDLGIDEIKKMFLRLNKTNSSLNPQELRNAEFNGKFIKLADEISTLPFWSENNIFTKTDLRRMNDIQIISTMLIFLRNGISDTGQAAINKMYDTYNDTYDEASEDLGTFTEILRILEGFLRFQSDLGKVYKTKVHFYTLFILAYYMIQTNQTGDLQRVSEKLAMWFSAYDRKEYTELANLEEFSVLSQEGSGKKYNRTRRFEILKAFIFS